MDIVALLPPARPALKATMTTMPFDAAAKEPYASVWGVGQASQGRTLDNVQRERSRESATENKPPAPLKRR